MLPATDVVHCLGTTGQNHCKPSESREAETATGKVRLRVWREPELDIDSRTAGGGE